jgi:hypothetical protein
MGIIENNEEYTIHETELKQYETSRGFQNIDFTDLYGKDCSLQISSLAGEDAIWFGCDKGGRMHLTHAMVVQLLPYLQNFVKGYELYNEDEK